MIYPAFHELAAPATGGGADFANSARPGARAGARWRR